MAEFSEFDPIVQLCLNEIEAVADRFLREGLDPAQVLSALAAVAVKTTNADPQYEQAYLDYFADVVRGAGAVTIVEK